MSRYRITTPEPGWTGQIGTVFFAGGVAEAEADADSAALSYFRNAGYGVEDLDGPADEQDAAESADGLPKKSASADAWRKYAIAHGMTADDADELTRDELVTYYTKEEDQ